MHISIFSILGGIHIPLTVFLQSLPSAQRSSKKIANEPRKVSVYLVLELGYG